MAETFYADKISCFSLELHWKKDNKSKNISYEIYQKEGGDYAITNFFNFEKIYEGPDSIYKVIDLKPNQKYTFKLKKIKSGKSLKEILITVTTLICPKAILSEKSIEIANNKEIINYNKAFL